MNLQTIRMPNSLPLRIVPAPNRVGRECACYGESRSTGCGTPAEETPQSRGNHGIACCAAAELYAILRKVQPSSLRNCSSIKLVQL